MLKKEAGGLAPRRSSRKPWSKGLREQLEHRLLSLVRDRQGRDRQLLASLQGEQVGAFLVLVGQHELVGAGLQGVDQVLGEVLTDLNRRGVGAERFSLGMHARQRGIEL